MRGLMQDWQLTNDKILEHARLNHPNAEVVSRTCEGPIERVTYADLYDRTRKLSAALARRGVRMGDRVGTIAWNNARHIESWYALLGVGAIYHTINPRLHPDQIAWIINDAEDRIVFTDLTFVPLLEKIGDKCPSVEAYVIMTDRAHMPDTPLPNVICYEELLASGDGDVEWGGFDENTAAGLCYTSGTTGNPKGVLYSHRGNTLMALMASSADMMGVGPDDSCLMVVPMFHANAWGLVFNAPMTGMKLVMPGPRMDGEAIYELLEQEKCTFSAAVPTVWLMLLQYLEQSGKKLPHLNSVLIGGSACPRTILEKFDKDYGVEVIHAWGMTEMSPLGTVSTLTPKYKAADEETQYAQRLKQGRTPFIVEMKIVNDDGEDLPRDGKTFGHLLVRGPAVAKAYFKGEGSALDAEGWFNTGDVATIDPDGYMQITDRSKDVIKSGGEWISSIDLENAAVGTPGVAEACVIGMPHPKWDERPLLLIKTKDAAKVEKKDVYRYLEGKIAKWWMPDDVVFVDDLAHTATGKLDKKVEREKFKDYVLPTVNEPAE